MFKLKLHLIDFNIILYTFGEMDSTQKDKSRPKTKPAGKKQQQEPE